MIFKESETWRTNLSWFFFYQNDFCGTTLKKGSWSRGTLAGGVFPKDTQWWRVRFCILHFSTRGWTNERKRLGLQPWDYFVSTCSLPRNSKINGFKKMELPLPNLSVIWGISGASGSHPVNSCCFETAAGGASQALMQRKSVWPDWRKAFPKRHLRNWGELWDGSKTFSDFIGTPREFATMGTSTVRTVEIRTNTTKSTELVSSVITVIFIFSTRFSYWNLELLMSQNPTSQSEVSKHQLLSLAVVPLGAPW